MDAIVGVLLFLAGGVLDRLHVNQGRDGELCVQMIDQVDKIVEYFHARFDVDEAKSKAGVTLFDYQMRSLVDDTTLLPVIGRRVFDGEYMRLITDIFGLSATEPGDVSGDERNQLLRSVNDKAIDLKKVINANNTGWRLFSQR